MTPKASRSFLHYSNINNYMLLMAVIAISSLPQSLLSDDFDALLDNIQGILMQYTSHKNNLTSELDGIHTD